MSFPINIVAAALLGLGEPAQGRSCAVAAAPARLPDVSAVVDVEALRVALAPALAEAPAAGDMLFSVRFKKDGQNEWVQGIGGAADVRIQAAVGRLIAAHLRNPGQSPEPWSLRLQVIPAATVQFQVSRSEVCPVERLEEGQPASGSRLTFRVLGSSDMDEIRRAGEFVVIVDVSPTGKVLTTHMRLRSGSRIVDDGALQTARNSRYRPALVDGIPSAGRYELSSRARVRSGAP